MAEHSWRAGVVAVAVAVGAGTACDGRTATSSADPACVSEETPPVASAALPLCIQPSPPLAFVWTVPEAVVVPFGEAVAGVVSLGVAGGGDTLTYTVSSMTIRCWDATIAQWTDVPAWRPSFSGADLSCAPGHQLQSPFPASFSAPRDAPVPPGGGLECVVRCEAATTTWCRQQLITPPSLPFPFVVQYVAVTGVPDDPAANFALDRELAYTGAVEGVSGDPSEWQQVRLAARTFTLAEPRDVALVFDFGFAPVEGDAEMRLDLRFKLDGYVVAEQRLSAAASIFEAVVPAIPAGPHVVSVEARGVRVGPVGVPVRLTGPAGGDARLNVVFR